MAGVLRVEREGRFARVTLDRPAVRNALDPQLIGELRDAFRALAEEPDAALRGIVLAGEGPVFCAGADVEWMRRARDLSVEENERDAAELHAMLAAIDGCPVPVIARVHGAALGGGMGLCAVADIVIATADATFGFTEAKLGIIPAVISIFVLPKIGESHARALFATGERFDAERARRIGLVHDVVPDLAALDERVTSALAELRTAGPSAARGAKALVRDLRALPPDEAGPEMARRTGRQRTSAEGQEGMTAFLDKRPAGWTASD
jgi:methylglutaconyl-CoA hydratase